MAGYQLTRVLPGTLGLRPFALSDKAKFFSVAPQPLRIAAAHGLAIQSSGNTAQPEGRASMILLNISSRPCFAHSSAERSQSTRVGTLNQRFDGNCKQAAS